MNILKSLSYTISISVLSLAVTACAGNKPAVSAEGADQNSAAPSASVAAPAAAETVAPPAPVASQNEVEAAKSEALKANEENHELSRQINELKVDLGISTIPTTAAKTDAKSGAAATDKAGAKAPAKAPVKTAKKK